MTGFGNKRDFQAKAIFVFVDTAGETRKGRVKAIVRVY